MQDLTMLVQQYGVSLVYFYDDTLLADRERAMELCDRISASGLPLKWTCQSRADQLDGEMCAALAASGCVQIEIGVESGDPQILDAAGKQISLSDVRRAFQETRAAGIQTKANFILGLPGETLETIRKTSALATEINPTYASFFHLVPFPGSDLFSLYKRNGWLASQDWSRFSYHGEAVVSLPGASSALLNSERRRALASFYLRAEKLIEIGFITLHSLDFRAVMRGGVSLVNALALGWKR